MFSWWPLFAIVTASLQCSVAATTCSILYKPTICLSHAVLPGCCVCLERQAPSALAWGDTEAEEGDSDSEDGDGGGAAGALSKERKEVEEAKKQAEEEARETAEEKRLRLARDVLMKLDAEQRENVRGWWRGS